MVEPFHVHVTTAGNGYLAENRRMAICAGGASPTEATENARAMASWLLNDCLHEAAPATLIARIDDDRYTAFVMRPFAQPFLLDQDDPETLYIDSAGRTSPMPPLSA